MPARSDHFIPDGGKVQSAFRIISTTSAQHGGEKISQAHKQK